MWLIRMELHLASDYAVCRVPVSAQSEPGPVAVTGDRPNRRGESRDGRNDAAPFS